MQNLDFPQSILTLSSLVPASPQHAALSLSPLQHYQHSIRLLLLDHNSPSLTADNPKYLTSIIIYYCMKNGMCS
jgi:hypothetical protein